MVVPHSVSMGLLTSEHGDLSRAFQTTGFRENEERVVVYQALLWKSGNMWGLKEAVKLADQKTTAKTSGLLEETSI
jgi:hypothetical protein